MPPWLARLLSIGDTTPLSKGFPFFQENHPVQVLSIVSL
jgi:hypothetical protein